MIDIDESENTVFLQIQNSKKPEQIISLVLTESAGDHFETRGLKALFGIDELRIGRDEFLASMEEYATLLSFLLETMSAAQDLALPYGYLDSFEHRGQRYSLVKRDGFRVLSRADV